MIVLKERSRLFESDYSEPVNIGSDEQVSINQMIEIIEIISGTKKLERVYQLDKPKGVRGRSSNNDLVKKILKWSFKIQLKDGLKKTYDWIDTEINKRVQTLVDLQSLKYYPCKKISDD